MQDNRAIDRALARLSAARPQGRREPAPKVSVETLIKHARRYGTEGVLYTAWELGFPEKTLIDLAETLDDIEREGERYKHKPLTRVQIRKVVAGISWWL